jgi:IS5 family transposase
MAGSVLGGEPITGHLFFVAPDSELKEVLDEALTLVHRTPAILTRIDEDRDVAALAKKALRQLDAQWEASQTAWLPDLPWPPASDPVARERSLEPGRPRMPAEVAYVFFVLQGYLGSVTDRRARDLLRESQTLNLYLESRGLRFPGWTTILENVNAISVDTRSFILDAQLAGIREDGLDDFLAAIVDSTSVHASSAWPTDARTLLGLLERAYRGSQKLKDFGLPNVPKHWVPRWLKKLQRLHFRINTATGKRDAARKRRKYYRTFLREAEKILDHLLRPCFERDPGTEAAGLPPSRQVLLARLWSGLQDDLINACVVSDYTYERIFEDRSRPANDKLLSLGDPTAAYIEKGGRQPVIGYKPQVARSASGFVTALLVTEGNDADSTQLTAVVEQMQQRTGVALQQLTADDGYAVEALRDQLLEDGLEKVYFCGTNAKAFTDEDEWIDPVYQQARRDRSMVESLVFVLKHLFLFGRLRRRGLAAVQAELLGKAVAHNFYRIVLLRTQARAAGRKAA